MADARPPSVAWFEELAVGDVASAGGKGANLGELTRAGLRVPRGFVVTAAAYLDAMEQADMRATLAVGGRGLAVDDADGLAAESERLQTIVHKAGLPPTLRRQVVDAYGRLGGGRVAVRSSATAEDTADASFAGMNQTFTNVEGEDELLARIVECWASLFGARVVSYRAARGMTDEPAIAVIVQEMVASERSGVMFTADPSTAARDRIVIEGAFGLGEVVVGGQVEPDTYIVHKSGPAVLDRRIGVKTHAVFTDPDGGESTVTFTPEQATREVLTDDEVLALARIGLEIEQHYESPQDVEWAMAGSDVYVLQSRPITTFGGPNAAAAPEVAAEVIVRGMGASPGVAVGPVRVLHAPDDAAAFVDGEIIVAPMTNPDWVPLLRRAGALVTDGGGMTCHAAIVSRELGVPCVVGTRRATAELHDGQVVTVDGAKGVVLAGAQHPVVETRAAAPAAAI
ncbi:MAG: PEP/pyruvate-binding domain-containing protein, partial [Actinomycetota bacterium]|nr:PEP/pyruvate-binding domain-containing protein [Actinomycetota bacterium]